MNKPIYIFLLVVSLLNFFDALTKFSLSVTYIVFFSITILIQYRKEIADYLVSGTVLEDKYGQNKYVSDEEEFYEIAKSVLEEMELNK